MWKAFAELEAIGFIGAKRPRMVAVQAAGCAPIVRAFERKDTHAERWENARTIASGIRVPSAIGDFLILAAVRESGGYAIAVDDDEIRKSLEDVARHQGILLCPEGAATHAAWRKSLREGRIRAGDRVVLFNCASGLKYPLPPADKRLDLNAPIDLPSCEDFGKGRRAMTIDGRQIAGWLLSALAILAVLVLGRPLLAPLAFAVLIWAILNALTDALAHLRLPRMLAWATSLLLIAAGLYLIARVLGTRPTRLQPKRPCIWRACNGLRCRRSPFSISDAVRISAICSAAPMWRV